MCEQVPGQPTHFRLRVRAPATGASPTNTFDFTVLPHSTESVLEELIVEIGTSSLVTARIGDLATTVPVSSVGSVDFVQLEAFTPRFDLLGLFTTGDVGAIRCHAMRGAVIGGNLTGPVVVSQAGTSVPLISNCQVLGDVLGSLSIPAGIIAGLLVDGRVGTETNPVAL